MWLNCHISFEEVYTSLIFVCQQCMSIHIPVLLKFYSFFLAVLGLRCCAGFSLVVRGAGFSLLTVCGLSSCRSQALEHRLLVVVGRLSCSLDVGSYRTRDWPGSSALAGGSLPLSHQGSPEIFTLKIIYFIIVPPCIMYHLSIYYLKKCSGNKRIARGVKLTELIEVLIIQARS